MGMRLCGKNESEASTEQQAWRVFASWLSMQAFTTELSRPCLTNSS